MKLLFVHDHIFFSSPNGDIYSSAAYPQKAWKRYLQHFSEVEVIGRYGCKKQNAKESLVLSSCPFVEFRFVPKISSPLAFMFNKRKVWNTICSCVRKNDAIVVRLPSENGFMAANAAILFNKPFSIEVVGCIWDALFNYGTIIAKIYAPFAYFHMRKCVSKSHRVLYVTKRFLQNRYPPAPNSFSINASNVELSEYDLSIVKYRGRKLSESKIIFGLIGNYKTNYKGLHVAIKALSTIKDTFNFEFRILGRGDTQKYINIAKKFGISDRVVFCGSLPNGKPVLNWLDHIDIYMQPSLAEGLPRALIEAMSRGCPCLASTAGGIPELLDHEFLHNPGDAKGLANTLKDLLSKDLKEVSFKNFSRVKEYKSDILNKRRFLFYEELRRAAEKGIK